MARIHVALDNVTAKNDTLTPDCPGIAPPSPNCSSAHTGPELSTPIPTPTAIAGACTS